MKAAELKDRRIALDITQAELARRIGSSQPAIAAIEAGKRTASSELLTRLASALVGPPSDVLAARREAVLATAKRHHATSVKVFGSVARGEDTYGSDIDLLVRFNPEASVFMWDVAALLDELTQLLAPYAVDLVEEDALRSRDAHIREQARPV